MQQEARYMGATRVDVNKFDGLICKSMAKRNRTEPFLQRIVTAGEKWVTYNNIKRAAQIETKGGFIVSTL